MASSGFSSGYGEYKRPWPGMEEKTGFMEEELQACWHAAAFPGRMNTVEGHRVRIVSPGWWNRLQGPDFQNAQVEFNGKVCTGDVEIHLAASDWYAHGHHKDPAYNGVMLHVIQHLPREKTPPAVTASGRKIATLVFPEEVLHKQVFSDEDVPARCGLCAETLARRNTRAMAHFLDLAGEWRVLDKARRIRERAQRVGMEQALYETFMVACGYSQFKKAFQLIAEALPYDRARQMAQQDPMSLETAFLRLGALWPEEWPHESDPPEHYQRLSALLREQMPGLKSLGLTWPRAAVRPANAPERRLAGAARFLTRTADRGLHKRLDLIWREPGTPLERRHAMEELFGGATGFWASHYSWQGPRAREASSPLGEGRIRTIIGNVLIPAALAEARGDAPNPTLEKHVHELFAALPREPENRIHRRMLQWLAFGKQEIRMNFRQQQGLMQIHEDWCAHNPSCRNCSVLAYLRALDDKEDS